MSLLDFFKTKPDENGKSDWDWGGKVVPALTALYGISNPESGKSILNNYISSSAAANGILNMFQGGLKNNNSENPSGDNKLNFNLGTVGKILPLAMLASDPQLASSYVEGRDAAIAQKQAEEENKRRREWEDFQHKVTQDQYMNVTPEQAGQFKGTKAESWFWTPEKSENKVVGSYDGTSPNVQKVTTEGQFIPQTMAKTDFQNLVNGVEQQKTNQTALEQKNKYYQDFIDSVTDPQLKGVLSTAYSTGNTNVLDKAMESMIPKPDQEMTPFQKEDLKIKWFNATKDKPPKPNQITQEQKDFINSISSKAGEFRSVDDYLADLNRYRDQIIQKTNTEAYNALVNDAKNNANNIWRQKNIGTGDKQKIINLQGAQFKKGKGSPLASLFGGNPRMLLANKNPSQPNTGNKPVTYNQDFLNKKGVNQTQVNAWLAEAKKKGIGFWDLVKQKYPNG